MFEHIHYLHHTWTAPCAPCAIYAHPIEFLIGNVTVVAAGTVYSPKHRSALAAVWLHLGGWMRHRARLAVRCAAFVYRSLVTQ